MRPLWVLVHGWGLDPAFWDPLLELPPLRGEEVVRVDLGFRHWEPGPAPRGAVWSAAAFEAWVKDELEPGRPSYGVGHSLGFAWLLRSGLRCDALVSMNGFPRFVRGDDGFPGVHPRVLARMRAKLPGDPARVTEEFLLRCGLEDAPSRPVDAARLGEGLDWLASWDERGALTTHGGPLLALAGSDDPIVPAAMSEACFPAGDLSWVEGGGHLLPLTHPGQCAELLTAVAERLA